MEKTTCPYCKVFRRADRLRLISKRGLRIHIKKSHGNHMLKDFDNGMIMISLRG